MSLFLFEMWEPKYKLIHVSTEKVKNNLTDYIRYIKSVTGKKNLVKIYKEELIAFKKGDNFRCGKYVFSVREVFPFDFNESKKENDDVDHFDESDVFDDVDVKKKLRFVPIQNDCLIPLSPSVS